MWLSVFGASSRRRLRIALACSLLLHLSLVALALWVHPWFPPVIVKSGEPLFIDLPPEKPEEPAPQGVPQNPVTPRVAATPTPPAPKAEPPRAPKPVPARPPAPKAAPLPEPLKAPEPAAVAKAPLPPEPEEAKPAPLARAGKEAVPPVPEVVEPKEAGGPRTALAVPRSEGIPSVPGAREPGGGLRRGRGGIEGEPIPLNTSDPRYTDYFDKIRRKIKANWVYPREAGERGIGGQLMIDFAISKNGYLEAIELRRSSGVPILDLYAMNAVKLAQPFPPVPDSVSKSVLPIKGIFTYQIVDAGLLNQFLR